MGGDKSDGQQHESIQDLVLVIDRAGLIENLFNQIISDYLAPREHAWHFMWSVVLDTSVMPLGAKLKVVAAIAYELNYTFPWKALNDVIQYRNSFAHNTTDAHPVISFGKTDEETTSYNLLYTLNAQGKLKKIKRHEAFELFNASYKASKAALVELKDLVKKQIAEHRRSRHHLAIRWEMTGLDMSRSMVIKSLLSCFPWMRQTRQNFPNQDWT